MYLTPPSLSWAANNTHYTGEWGQGAAGGRWLQPALDCDFTPARNVMWAAITFVHSFKLFQIWAGPRRLQSFRVNGSLVRKQSEWKCWDAETLDPKKCHYQDEKIVSAGHKTSDKMQSLRKQIDGISQQKFIPSRTTDTQSKVVFSSLTPKYCPVFPNKYYIILGIISRMLSDNHNIGVSNRHSWPILSLSKTPSWCCFQCSCFTIPDQSRSHWTGSDLSVTNCSAMSVTAQCIITNKPSSV